jgi:hypothetical protein
MEERFGHDFSHVRLHSDPAAHMSAARLRARAYTVGHHIVLGEAAPDLSTTAGRHLLGHELAHVVQQSRGGVADGIDPDPALEAEADRAGAQIASGRPLSGVRGVTSVGVQRAAEDSEHPNLEKVAKYTVQALGMSEGTSRVVAASLEGGFTGFSHQWNEGGTGARVGKKLGSFSIRDLPSLMQGYVVGVLEGIVSPVTDLFQIGVMLEQLNDFLMKLASSAMSRLGELVQDLKGVLSALPEAVRPIREFFNGFRKKSKEAFKSLMELLAGNQSLVDQAAGMAHSIGKTQGAALAESFESPWSDKKEAESAPVGLFTWASNLAGKGRDALVEGPWAKIGNKAGYALGFAAVQVAMLAFSGGIGNLISQIGRGLGGVAKAGSFLGKSIGGVARFIGTAGSIITKVEEAINAAVSLVMNPLMPVLEPLLKPLGNVMERLGGFLRKLFGIAEKDASQVAVAALAKTGGGEHPSVPHGTDPSAHVPHAAAKPDVPHGEPSIAAKPMPEPHPAGASRPNTASQPALETPPSAKAAPDPAVSNARDVHPTSNAPSNPTSKTSRTQMPDEPQLKAANPASDTAHKPLAEPEPVGGGHHTQVTPDGIEMCSPVPCPHLRGIYKAQLDASDELRKEMERLDVMRKVAARLEAQGKPDPALAKRISKDAALLQKKLEAARTKGPSSKKLRKSDPGAAASKAASPARDRATRKRTPDQEFSDFVDELKKGGVDQVDVRSKTPGKTSGSTASKEKPLEQDIGVNIDEHLPVGAKKLDPAVARDRALSLDNRGMKEAILNQRTKHLGIDTREAAQLGKPRDPVSLKAGSHPDGNEHLALFDRRFSEIKELNEIGEDALQKMTGKTTRPAKELKAELNARIWQEIHHGNSPNAVAVREAFERSGFGAVLAPNNKLVMRALTEHELLSRGLRFEPGKGWIRAIAP